MDNCKILSKKRIKSSLRKYNISIKQSTENKTKNDNKVQHIKQILARGAAMHTKQHTENGIYIKQTT